MNTANKRKVGGVIIMHPGQNNYGTSLQGFATVQIIQALGYPLRIIRYKKKRSSLEMLKVLPGYLRSGAISSYLKHRERKNFLTSHPEYAANIKVRTDVVNAFKEKYFEPLCDYYTGWRALSDGSKNYDIIFVGSDQVWGPLSLYAGFYNLLFVDKSVPQFSYSSSFGKSSIMKHQRTGVARFLNKMDAIGVREIRGKEIVEELTNKKATVVADPTMLLTRSEWEEAIAANGAVDISHFTGLPPSEPYILCYMLGPRTDNREAVTQLGRLLGMKIVTFRHMDWYEPADEGFGDISVYNANCIDFINLLKNAAYVATDSFHCTVFSIIFHKQFLTFYRLKPTEKGSSHSRIDSLFNILGLLQRTYPLTDNSEEDTIASKMQQNVDWDRVDMLLSNFRADSMKWLEHALELKKEESRKITSE